MKDSDQIVAFALPGARGAAASARGRDILDRLGMDCLAAVASCAAGEVLVAGGHRLVRKLEHGGEILFLKQARRGGRPALGELLRHGRRSSSRREAENVARIEELGLRGPEILAWGESFRGLREDFSFLLCAAAPGRDLHEHLAGAPGPAEVAALAAALAEVVVRLARAGLCFTDLVPRHVFVSGPPLQPVLTLIDLHRLDAKPTTEAAAAMLARLDGNLPAVLLSSGRRLAFLRRLESILGAELLAGFRDLRRDFERRRRNPRARMARPAAARSDWRLLADGVFVRGAGAEELAGLGLPTDADAARLAAAVPAAAARGLELLLDPLADLREVYHGHHFLAGWVEMPEILARRLDRDGSSFILRRVAPGRPLPAVLGGPPPVEVLAGRMSRVLEALLEGRFWPRDGLVVRLNVIDDRLVYRPGPTGPGNPRGLDLRRRVRDELRAGGLDADRVDRLVAALDPLRPGLLGGHRSWLETPENEGFR